VIYGLTVQQMGRFFDFRCPECMGLASLRPLVRESGPLLKISCEVHPRNFGEWKSEVEMQQEKLALAKRIGLLE
jgi:hypothetical protein